MKLNKMTLAAVVTLGVLASTNAGFTQETATEPSTELLAACPLSGCPSPVTPQTAKCPKCLDDIDSCSCQPKTTCNPCEKKNDCNTCKPISDACNPCPPIAQCPAPSSPTCAVCPATTDDKKFQQQVYAYPNAIYGNNQVVGERNNALYIGDDSLPGFSGVPVSTPMQTAAACGCEDGSMTGAAAPMPCLDNTPYMHGIPVDRNPGHLDTAGCPVQIHTNTSMDVMKRTLEPFEYSAATGGAAPIVSAFEDVPDGFWASCDINVLTDNNVIAGYPDRTFKPNLPVSRAEMATLVVKGFNLNENVTCPNAMFKDVPESHWANKTIAKAVSNGLMSGYPNNLFKPNQPISRAEAFSIMAKGINCPMDDCKADEVLSKYCDGNSVPGWAKIPVAKVLETGGISEFPNPQEIAPNKDASRAEIASMLENVRIALGYSSNDRVTSSDCGCTPKKAFYHSEEVVTIPTLQLTFNDEISAKSANVGDRFAAKTIDSVTINGIEFPAGSRVDGKVLEVVRPTKHCQGALKLSFNTIKNGKCKADLPNQILTAQVNKVKKPNGFARLIEFPFTWTGGLLGDVGRTVGGAIVSASNAVEQTVSGIGVGTGEIFQGEFKAAGRSYLDVGKAIVKAPIDVTRTALSGTMGLFQYTGDEITYLVDPKGMRVSSVNPKEKVTIAFGCHEQ
ncbi:MAG: S-layer homology domain-containing protein [Candidatus Gastranaerophilales bacterium]|nr:S-layer homology domain-containing protein [Candidatus Gastranaerophilales bacterium]